MRLSVIVPVYKVEKYLARCVRSILAQPMKDLELILVDDGSPDNSGAICDDFAAREDRVKVIHQANAGVSAARNAGVAAAQGEYISFVDSDDWVSPNMYERMLQAAEEENADIVKCGFDRTDGKEIHECQGYGAERQCYKENIVEHWFGKGHIFIWNAVYRAELARKVKYPVGITGGEDDYASFFYLYYGRSMVLLPDCLYNYFINSEGSSANPDWFYMRMLASEAMWSTIRERRLELPEAVYKKLKWNWAKRWYHYIREEKNAELPSREMLDEIMLYLDFRRKLAFKLALLRRKFRGK